MKCFFKNLKITNLNQINNFNQKGNNLQMSKFQIEKPYQFKVKYCKIFGFKLGKIRFYLFNCLFCSVLCLKKIYKYLFRFCILESH